MSEWSTLEKLVLVQTFYRTSDANWATAAKNFRNHPLCINNPQKETVYSQKRCASIYQGLIEGLETGSRKKRQMDNSQSINGGVSSSSNSTMPDAVKAARRLMMERMSELKELSTVQKSFAAELSELALKILDCETEEALKECEKRLSFLQNTRTSLSNALLFPDKIIGRNGHTILSESEDTLHTPPVLQPPLNPKTSSSEVKKTSLDETHPVVAKEMMKDSLVMPKDQDEKDKDDDDVPIAQQLRTIKQLKTDTESPIEDGSELNLSAQQRNWKKSIMLLWNDISSYRCSSLFQNPVKAEEAPKYHQIIKCPIDLGLIKQRIRDNVIKSTAEFHRDILHMLQNAFIYNDEDSEEYDMAKEMRIYAEERIAAFKESEAEASNLVTLTQPLPSNATTAKPSSPRRITRQKRSNAT